MAHRWTNDLTAADVTPKAALLNRRQIIAGTMGLGAIAAGLPAAAQDALEPNTLEEITTYNNYYEFGTGKDDPATNAHQLVTSPWSIRTSRSGSVPATAPQSADFHTAVRRPITATETAAPRAS